MQMMQALMGKYKFTFPDLKCPCCTHNLGNNNNWLVKMIQIFQSMVQLPNLWYNMLQWDYQSRLFSRAQNFIYTKSLGKNRSLANKGPRMKECPPPPFDPISGIGSRFTQMSTHPIASFTWGLRSISSSAMRISGKKRHVILHRN